MSDLNMPGVADGVQSDDPDRDDDLEVQSQMGEDPGVSFVPPPPD
jgi:hypothetical protein